MSLALLAPAALALAPVAVADMSQAPAVAQEAPPLPPASAPPSDVQPAPAAEPVAMVPQRTTPAIRSRGDPLQGFNRAMFGLHEGLDKALYRPAAMGYKAVVPKPVRSGIRNILSNLTEPIIFLNFLLQAKPGKAVETLGRFVTNSTLGIGGLFDVAKSKDINLPHRSNSFGSTLAIWGVGPGPYLFLPFMGPTTLRDFAGGPVDGAVLPVAIGRPFDTWQYQLATGVSGGLDRRAEADPELKALFADAVDRYATLRSVWLQNRAAEIEELRGHARKQQEGAPDELGDPLADPGASDATDTTPPPSELSDPLEDPAGASAPSPQ